MTVGQCSWSWSSVILDKLELEDLIETSNIIEQAVLYFNLEMSTSSDCWKIKKKVDGKVSVISKWCRFDFINYSTIDQCTIQMHHLKCKNRTILFEL